MIDQATGVLAEKPAPIFHDDLTLAPLNTVMIVVGHFNLHNVASERKEQSAYQLF
jgi:hypothetical protein